jgi:hypothetical protein
LLLKFQQVPPFKQFLLETTNRPLLHNVGSSWWGTGLDGTGINTQGVLLMQLRDSHLSSVSGPDSPRGFFSREPNFAIFFQIGIFIFSGI